MYRSFKAGPFLAYMIASVAAIMQVPRHGLADESQTIELSRRIDVRLNLTDVDENRFANDEDFLRRATLDLAGRIPTISEVHAYLEESPTTRRATALRRLMKSGIYHKNMATFWRRAWVPQADTREFAHVSDGFETWLAGRLRERTRYSQLVVDVLTLDTARPSVGMTTPVGFYDANLAKPENLAASSTRAFLGINLDCAQCHDHPFSRWTREQFWQTAAFFAPPPLDENRRRQLPKVKVPDTELEYHPVLLDKRPVEATSDLDSIGLRRTFVDWMRHDDERLLAKNAVNRLWAHFFGEAIVEPIDDLSRAEFQTGERAELLGELADAFIASEYDLDLLVEALVNSNAYRLSSSGPSDRVPMGEATTDPGKGAPLPLRITKASVRGLTGEQLYDSLHTAAGLPADRKMSAGGARRDRRRDFAAQFYVERTHNAERSISQSLALMNGDFVQGLTTAKGNPMLASLLSSPFMTLDEQIDTVYVAVLGRHVSESETWIVSRHFDANPDTTREQRLGNLFWVLVNSSEFNTNH